jgi:RNA polymerase primary sigma factor
MKCSPNNWLAYHLDLALAPIQKPSRKTQNQAGNTTKQDPAPKRKTPQNEPEHLRGEINTDCLGAFLAKVSQYHSLSQEEETKLLEEVAAGGTKGHEACGTLILHNQKLVVAMARRYSRMGCPMEDLISEGNIGLQQAIQKFDTGRGTRLATYAVWWIKQYLRGALNANCRTIRIPTCHQKTVRAIHQTAGKLTEVTGHYPSDEEIAEEIGVSTAKVEHLRNLTLPIMSLQSPTAASHEGSQTLEDVLADQTGVGESPLETLGRKNRGQSLVILIHKRLNKTEQDVVKLRFGLEGQEPNTLEEVGAKLKLTRERIRQIQEAALKKLRTTLEAEEAANPTLLSVRTNQEA